MDFIHKKNILWKNLKRGPNVLDFSYQKWPRKPKAWFLQSVRNFLKKNHDFLTHLDFLLLYLSYYNRRHLVPPLLARYNHEQVVRYNHEQVTRYNCDRRPFLRSSSNFEVVVQFWGRHPILRSSSIFEVKSWKKFKNVEKSEKNWKKLKKLIKVWKSW